MEEHIILTLSTNSKARDLLIQKVFKLILDLKNPQEMEYSNSSNEISLHLGVPDNQISLHFGVPYNQISVHLGVLDILYFLLLLLLLPIGLIQSLSC